MLGKKALSPAKEKCLPFLDQFIAEEFESFYPLVIQQVVLLVKQIEMLENPTEVRVSVYLLAELRRGEEFAKDLI